MITGENRWVAWAREIEALAQAGYTYASNPYERERSVRLREIAAEIISANSQLSIEEVQFAFEAQPGYVTPKVDVRAAVFMEEKLLFVREAMDGRWTLPGGWADVGEPPSRRHRTRGDRGSGHEGPGRTAYRRLRCQSLSREDAVVPCVQAALPVHAPWEGSRNQISKRWRPRFSRLTSCRNPSLGSGRPGSTWPTQSKPIGIAGVRRCSTREAIRC